MKAVKPAQLRPAGVFGVASALIGAGAAHAVETGALPQNPTVAGGAASFAQSGRTLTVNQSTDRTVIDWRSFDIGQGATTVFNQPNASSIAVNRVNGSANPTQIEGSLTANGQVWILNPNGVLFGKGARDDVAGLLASTANLDAARFMAGDTRLSFTGSGRGQVVNAGQVSVAANGLAAFVAPSVRNSGTITATVGKVALAAGETFSLDLAGDHLVELGLGAGKAVVDQSGRIVDAGGVVTLSARSAGQVVDSVINMSGWSTPPRPRRRAVRSCCAPTTSPPRPARSSRRTARAPAARSSRWRTRPATTPAPSRPAAARSAAMAVMSRPRARGSISPTRSRSTPPRPAAAPGAGPSIPTP
jgi:filamentous hemagglutinin family protein